jgi:hypothetical protein
MLCKLCPSLRADAISHVFARGCPLEEDHVVRHRNCIRILGEWSSRSSNKGQTGPEERGAVRPEYNSRPGGWKCFAARFLLASGLFFRDRTFNLFAAKLFVGAGYEVVDAYAATLSLRPELQGITDGYHPAFAFNEVLLHLIFNQVSQRLHIRKVVFRKLFCICSLHSSFKEQTSTMDPSA